ncbi:alpha/beta hydrolase [Gloeobacter kilaueensis]|uniref:Alpha/beta hydrolase fold protein n=1 Tax=Gloeobacter kilaueensis (strain ATCC BAA-2537 / CCAP 1431/1 / ULC 316 / JS1) TaxID=1183438 RepID=U5QHX3_GLOK1|nr:alpha/beta hydrolase [Gloeobacter kilaueensis]AGY58468.1 alpha/beta hydrolase fold protein [Gloeobacter kilaueensis JS1]
MVSTAHTDLQLKTADGLRLHLSRWEATVPVCGTVLVIPGKGEHGGRYTRLADCLAPMGWRVWGLDLRGQGRSEGPPARVDRFGQFLIDVEAALEGLGNTGKDRPVVLLGYSMGAVVATLAALEWPERIRGLICVSPAFSIENRLPRATKVAMHLLNWLAPHRILTREYNPARVTTDVREQERIAADPLINGITRARLVSELRRAGRLCIVRAERLTLPTLVLLAPVDAVVEVAGTRQFFDRLGSNDRMLKEYADCRHDLLHDHRSAQVQSDIQSWLQQRYVSR